MTEHTGNIIAKGCEGVLNTAIRITSCHVVSYISHKRSDIPNASYKMTKFKNNHSIVKSPRTDSHGIFMNRQNPFSQAFSHPFPMKMENLVPLNLLVHPHSSHHVPYWMAIFDGVSSIFHALIHWIYGRFPWVFTIFSWVIYGFIHGFWLKTLIFNGFS